MSRARGLAALLLLFAVIAYLVPHPDSVSAQGWRQFAIFVTTIAGMILEPLPAAALVLMGLVAMVANGAPLREAFAGFAESAVWLVLVAMLVARAMLKAGLGRRIALLFLRAFGRSSLGISYSLVATDVVLAGGVPSIAARSGCMVLPVPVSIAELFDSRPGPTARRLGTFLIAAMYQASAVACAMFLTGQASNVLGAALALRLAGVSISWFDWLVAASVPGLVGCAVVPWVVYRLLTPEIRSTPEAASFARSELAAMGPLTRAQGITLAVFAGVGSLWFTSAWHGLDVAFVALLGLCVLLATGTMTWQECVSEAPAWNMFIWYGGLLRMGEMLNSTGVTQAFATAIGSAFTGIPWFAVLIAILLVYYYSHYFFASITAHLLAMFPPFVILLVSIGAPPKLAVFSLLCLANLTAGLTHYGTTSAPILFGLGYVSLRDWWRTGFIVSLANLAIWLTVGLAWWKALGFW